MTIKCLNAEERALHVEESGLAGKRETATLSCIICSCYFLMRLLPGCNFICLQVFGALEH